MANSKYRGLVIVESPTKAKKINSYLGSSYVVMASMGHVCDLPNAAEDIPSELKKSQPWTKLGVNVNKGFEPFYVVAKEKQKLLKELKTTLRSSEKLIIATDEDREGESIGWHLVRLLEPKIPVERMVFSEITKQAIQQAIANPRKIDENLVAAQETRRILDRLYGYTLSPLLWKKVKPKLSAGRVQSVAVRILVQRELERLAFHSATYWDLKASLQTNEGARFDAVLSVVKGQRLASGKDFDESTGKLKNDSNVTLLDQSAAESLRDQLRSGTWTVSSVEVRPGTRKPAPPFTTSTLQQDSNRKLNMSARETMQVAQRLYEEGYITYMRTDSVNLSQEAIQAARTEIGSRYGNEYLSPSPRQFTTKSGNAQEAHEAIRPAGTEMKTAEELGLAGKEHKLYSLIWKRTIASQMAEARLQFQNVGITVADAEFRASGKHIEFPGFFRAYVEGTDDPEAALDDQEDSLPPLSTNQSLGLQDLAPLSHETKPPARYTEATLVKMLEERGIGRPSTYASILSTIQDRGYAVVANKQLIPTFTGMAVNKLLESHFLKLVDIDFTAKMEQTLDDIASGNADRLPYLVQFYSGPEGLEEQVRNNEEKIDPREACTMQLEGLDPKIRIGKFGPYLEQEVDGKTVTASIPPEITPADLNNQIAEEIIQRKQQGPKSLGSHPESGLPLFVLHGPFGHYLQLGEVVEGEAKPKRVGIPKNFDAAQITMETALELIALPRVLGHHPTTGKTVAAGIGMYGPYVLHEKKYKSIPKTMNVLTITLDDAVLLLEQVPGRRRDATPIREVGSHPADGATIAIFEGQYGPYVKHNGVNATIPKDRDVESVTVDDAVEWLEARIKRGPPKKGKRGSPRGGSPRGGSPRGAKSAKAPEPKKPVARKKATGNLGSRSRASKKPSTPKST